MDAMRYALEDYNFKTFQVYSSFFINKELKAIFYFKTFQVYSSSAKAGVPVPKKLNFKTFQVYSS